MIQRGTLILLIILALSFIACGTSDRGTFEKESNIGDVQPRGMLEYDEYGDYYRITSGGKDIQGEEDEFYYLSKQLSGDFSIIADISFRDSSANYLKKAGWMVRASMDKDSPYVGALSRGDNFVLLQYRKEKGGPTHTVLSGNVDRISLRLERTGDLFSLYLIQGRNPMKVVGNVVVNLPRPVHVGLATAASADDDPVSVDFTNVTISEWEPPEEPVLESTVEVMNIGTGVREVVRKINTHFEAPNWSPDGEFLLVNRLGKLHTIELSSGIIRPVETDFADRINNDHGYSPDGSMLAISHSPDDRGSIIYTLPAEGGMPVQITENAPSYWHGWSPDGRMLAYTARRDGNFDIYVIPADGSGEEVRLTEYEGLDDGPDYSPDGQYIYFNSNRTGSHKIWRMAPDGSNKEQLTFQDEYADWFPHPSPDGQWVVFLSYEGHVTGHPPNKPVTLRIMPAGGGEPYVIATLFGGQGTINVPSWSPDSQSIAFVSYRMVQPD